MIIAKRLKGKAIATWLGPTGDAARRALTRARQRITNAAGRLDLYVDIADPMSFLTAQAVRRLIEAYPVEVVVHVVTPPASDVDAAPTLRAKHAVRDAQQVAAYWNIAFPGTREADSGTVRDVGTSMIKNRPGPEQLRAFLDLTSAMWAGDKKKVGVLLLQYGTESSTSIPPILNSAYAELRKAGHYQAAMIHYAGEWYWGIDRLPYLEAALGRDLGTTAPPVVPVRDEAERGPLALSDKPLVCELWFSFRSPYSYLALETIEGILAPQQVPLVLKPIQPAAARGIPLPQVKQMYIVRDAKREADRLGVAFGELCDPVGKGIENCLGIAHWAQQRGADQAMAFCRSALRGIWSEALDVAEYIDLRQIVERAGLPWTEAQAAIGAPAAAKAAMANATEMALYSLWGVPSVRCGDFIAWGQDRLPLLADRLRRHALVKPIAGDH
jgi:2-hydroxychromene-2-carboxylate isomerase